MKTKIILRKHQKNAICAIEKSFETHNKCLVKMFCGTGKSRIIFYMMMNNNYNLSVVVFPSISLITQFNTDYIQNKEWIGITENHKYLSICSKNELQENTHNINYTTENEDITDFLNKKDNKIICITYQSFETFVNCISDLDIEIDLIAYDEAHHIVGSKIQKLVFNNEIFNDKCIKTVFFTATPKNENGITMLERDYEDINYELIDDEFEDEEYFDDEEDYCEEIPYKTDCGTLAFEYTHYQAVQDGICNDFDIAIDFYTDNSYKYKSIYSAIARCIFNTNNKKCLTFHARSEVEADNSSYVMDFTSNVNKNKFKKEYEEVLQEEFPDLIEKYTNKLIIDGLTAKTKNKPTILNNFDKDRKNVRILASCNTIGEGIDTKNANIVCFVDPRTSYSTITQNIGRVCRKQEQNSTILIPCYVDRNKYINCKTDEERDLVIREDMSKDGNYNSILNILSALRQDDPELYDLCLHYPKSYAPKEVKDSLWKQGYKIEQSVGDLDDTITYLVDEELDLDLDLSDVESIEDKAQLIDKKIIIHSTSMEEPIKVYNNEAKDSIVIYHNEENDEYRPVVKKDSMKKTKNIKAPNRKKININVHKNKDIKVLWNIDGDFDLDKIVFQAYISSTIVENYWEEKLEEVKNFIDENKRKPSIKHVNEKNLIGWINHQQSYYNDNKYSMKDEDKRHKWEDFLEEYKEYFLSNDEIWNIKLEKVKEFINKNKKKPSNNSKNIDEKKLSGWIRHRTENYKNNIGEMQSEDKKKIWEDFIEEYREYFLTNINIWNNKLDKVKDFINKYNKKPNSNSKNENEKVLGKWMGQQHILYDKNIQIMKIDNIRQKWEDLLEEYKEYIITLEEKWKNNLNLVKKFIKMHEKRPTEDSNENDEKILGKWLNDQYSRYKNNKITEINKLTKFKKFLEKYNRYFLTNLEMWYNNLNKIKIFINENNIKPRRGKNISKEEEKLGKFISTQQINYKKKIYSMKDKEKRQKWAEFVLQYPDLFDTSYLKEEDIIQENDIEDIVQEEVKKPTKLIKVKINKKSPKSKEDVKKTRKQRNKVKLSELHQKYKTMNSNNLNKLFNENSQLWKEYHEIAEKNEQGFIEQDEIPYKRIIRYLENMKTKRDKYIADLGCGKARIAEHFKNNNLFKFYNYDHYAENDNIENCDISNLPLEDNDINIAIMSLCMWGSNCKDYIKEAHRVLEDNGILLIIEPTKRWIDDNRLENILIENNFKLKKNHSNNDDKFMFLECVKL